MNKQINSTRIMYKHGILWLLVIYVCSGDSTSNSFFPLDVRNLTVNENVTSDSNEYTTVKQENSTDVVFCGGCRCPKRTLECLHKNSNITTIPIIPNKYDRLNITEIIIDRQPNFTTLNSRMLKHYPSLVSL
ncbi:hypothetical protein CHUAL_000650 [Chamberlinius hualienensis]